MSETFRDIALISDQLNARQVGLVIRELEATLRAGVTGDIVEFGCYEGGTSLFMARALLAHADKSLHVYDSFAGLPEKSSHDDSPAGTAFTQGSLTVSKRRLLENFHRARLPAPHVHKGWFDRLSATDIPDAISFALIDADFYSSTIDALRLVWPRMSSTGIIVFDDYAREALPGVAAAVRDFFRDDPNRPDVIAEQNMGICRL